jgi:type II secretory pathway pseudopilin PulG
MHIQNNKDINDVLKSTSGFTLLEAMLSVVLLGLVAFGISAPYLSGFQALDVQTERMLLDSQLRSRMEVLIGTDFDALANGSEVVIVQGQNFTLAWVISNEDMDGDGTPESTAKKITVSITERPGRTLKMIVVNNEDKIKKIS